MLTEKSVLLHNNTKLKNLNYTHLKNIAERIEHCRHEIHEKQEYYNCLLVMKKEEAEEQALINIQPSSSNQVRPEKIQKKEQRTSQHRSAQPHPVAQ
ncbi:Endoplasmic reticulum junction formation protein lunapark [Trichinella pseudospiralis]